MFCELVIIISTIGNVKIAYLQLVRGFIARARRVFNIELHIAREKNKLLSHFQKWEKLTNS